MGPSCGFVFLFKNFWDIQFTFAEQLDGASASAVVQVVKHDTGGFACRGTTTTTNFIRNDNAFIKVNGISNRVINRTAFDPLWDEKKEQLGVTAKLGNIISRFHGEEETVRTQPQLEEVANCVEEWNDVGAVADDRTASLDDSAAK